ncbi:hypothetical protein G4G27_10090 [Sphingomonas sp. So64.6b]|nr:hypothetical protein [Sphingomonas sp. So64.6b]QNA84299.1 hypothetical protein G4G27_10090 [Sphingomonas sp. So64.6b]
MKIITILSVRPELVEGPFFFPRSQQGQGFDKLSPNGGVFLAAEVTHG